jgi:tryptophan synthase alpha chain
MGFESATTSPDVLERHFVELRSAGRRALVVYITAGHPDPDRSLELLRKLGDAGADVVEVGVPFSDPMADGVVIQASSQRALAHGMTLDKTLDLIARARVRAPVVLFSYLNPLLASRASLLERAADAGAHGILVTDLPVGADPELETWLGAGPLAFVRLVAPTTPRVRMAEIGRHGRGFVYLISRLGVTGERSALPDELPATVAALRQATSLPICVGFGISRPEHVAAVGRLADGVVVGSAVVRAADNDIDAALSLVRAMRSSLDELS